MEVDAASFHALLLGLFINVSEADFVAVDFELSGVPSKMPDKPARGPARFTLEERYAEAKRAADRYQILQVGITCARFDHVKDKYVLRPYNVFLSPLLDERIGFEREFSFQSGSCSFLLSHGFDMGAPFARGVHYLSREEAVRAKRVAWDRAEKKNPVPDLQVKDDDVETLDFFRRAREAIARWKKAGTARSVDITTYTGMPEQFLEPAITNFEKRIVYQLVRNEFPDLACHGRKECIRVSYFDPNHEADHIENQKKWAQERIGRQTGFRWIFEALAQGGVVDGADSTCFLKLCGGLTTAADPAGIKERFDRAVERLRKKKPVLVGHNMFVDLVYLYRTFVGQLPNTLADFKKAIHELFPKVVDTKYLATHDGGDLHASPSLEKIAKNLSSQALPEIMIHPYHYQYEGKDSFHEAGYDSLLTATILLQLAANLKVEQSSHCSTSKGNEKINEATTQSTDEPEQSSFQADTMSKKARRIAKKKEKSKSEEAVHGKFHTSNVFDVLGKPQATPSAETENTPSSKLSKRNGKRSGEAASEWNEEHNGEADSGWDNREKEEAGSWQNQQFVQDTSNWKSIEQVERQPMEMIPAFDTDFWKLFGNTLRVFGTEETVLRLADW